MFGDFRLSHAGQLVGAHVRHRRAAFVTGLCAALRRSRIRLGGATLENVTCCTIPLHLLKIGALSTVSLQRLRIAFVSSCPAVEVFVRAVQRLCPVA